MATITGDMIINDVIKKYPQTIKVFNDYKVDSCCGGGAPIEATAKQDRINVEVLLKSLNEAVGGSEAKGEMKVMEPQYMNAAFEEAYNSGDIERLMALYEPDAVMAPSPGKRAVGIFAIRDVLLRLLAINGRMTCRNLYCMRVDRIALLQAEWKLSGTRPDGKPVEMSSRTAEVVRQQEDNSWRYIIDHAFASD